MRRPVRSPPAGRGYRAGMGRRVAAGGAGALLLLAAGCTARGPSPPQFPAGAGSPPPVAAVCPTAYTQPDPARPRIALRFDLAADHRSVRGVERVVFRPDLPVTEMVFRLWPNNARSAAAGARLRVTAARVAGRVVRPAVSPDPTLLHLPLGRTAAAGTVLTAELAFSLLLPAGIADRYGHTLTSAWWGTGQPLLAWERSVGWATEPAAVVLSESTTSEDAAVDLTVRAPSTDTVLTVGPTRASAPAGGFRSWHTVVPAVRDVSVAVGPFTLRHAVVAGVPVVVGVAPGSAADPDELLAEVGRSLPTIAARVGPFPYVALSVASLPGLGSSGMEYPAAIFVGEHDADVVVPHEVAHQWFYGLVGDDQARDPWLDEAFATYQEALVNRSADRYTRLRTAPGRVGAPVRSFAAADYGRVVYGKGAAALLAARDAAGPAAFDAAVRCYVAAQARRVARPADLARALEALPAALAALRTAGALPGDPLAPG